MATAQNLQFLLLHLIEQFGVWVRTQGDVFHTFTLVDRARPKRLIISMPFTV